MSYPEGIIIIPDNLGIGTFSHLGGAGNVLIRESTTFGLILGACCENHTFDINGVFMDFKKQKVLILVAIGRKELIHKE